MLKQQKQTLFFLTFTAILLGYLTVWLPGPSAGLQFLGFEMGEWSKFLGVGVKRNWFYLPPLTLAMMMLFFTMGWDNGRYQTWLFRGVAAAISLLAFPALEDLAGASQSEYLSRLVGIFLVAVVAVLLTVLRPGKRPLWRKAGWGFVGVAGLVGLIWPTLIYLEVRPFASQIIGIELGYGIGFWLNALGHTAVAALAFYQLAKK